MVRVALRRVHMLFNHPRGLKRKLLVFGVMTYKGFLVEIMEGILVLVMEIMVAMEYALRILIGYVTPTHGTRVLWILQPTLWDPVVVALMLLVSRLFSSLAWGWWVDLNGSIALE